MADRIARYEQAAALLPPKWQRLARQLPDYQKARAEELRLRTGQCMTVLLPEAGKSITVRVLLSDGVGEDMTCDLWLCPRH